jgi:hypothetical protein
MPCSHDQLIDLIELSRPPDDELVDLIESAFLEGQIDGLKADLAYWLLFPNFSTKAGTFAGTNDKYRS